MTRVDTFRFTALLAGLIIVCDQATKSLVRSQISIGQEIEVFPGIQLVHVSNSGIAFGALRGGGILLVVFGVVALVGLSVLLFTGGSGRWAWLAAGLVLGGAIGNMADRVRDGRVTDFISFPHWPAFNVADIAITSGMALLLLRIVREKRGSERG